MQDSDMQPNGMLKIYEGYSDIRTENLQKLRQLHEADFFLTSL